MFFCCILVLKHDLYLLLDEWVREISRWYVVYSQNQYSYILYWNKSFKFYIKNFFYDSIVCESSSLWRILQTFRAKVVAGARITQEPLQTFKYSHRIGSIYKRMLRANSPLSLLFICIPDNIEERERRGYPLCQPFLESLGNYIFLENIMRSSIYICRRWGVYIYALLCFLKRDQVDFIQCVASTSIAYIYTHTTHIRVHYTVALEFSWARIYRRVCAIRTHAHTAGVILGYNLICNAIVTQQ